MLIRIECFKNFVSVSNKTSIYKVKVLYKDEETKFSN